MTKIAIVDYGMGNLHSVMRAVCHAAPEAEVTLAQDSTTIDRADRLVFPGQGAMRDCMHNLQESGLLDSIQKAARNKPLLGICVGQQMMMRHSEEGDSNCLSWFDAPVKRFSGSVFAQLGQHSLEALKVPHMGWSIVHQCIEHPLWQGIKQDSYYYFVHSYYVQIPPESPDWVVGRSLYGLEFASAIARDNIFAVQFHPEKSAEVGLQLLSNFAHWNPS